MSNNLATLFKKDAAGNTVEWSVRVENVDGVPNLVTVYGRVGGQLQEHYRAVPEGKNAGRKNATTPREQAEKEAEAEWRKRLERKGYSLDGERESTAGVMLAVDYHDLAKRRKGVDLPEEVIVQPKLDGIRAKTENHRDFLSRGGISYRAIPDRIRHYLSGRGLPPLDGEMYIHGVPLRHLSSAVNNPDSPYNSRLEYHLFDLPIAGPVEERMEQLEDLLDWEEAGSEGIFFVPPQRIRSTAVPEVKRLFERGNFEGIMIRLLGSPYLFQNKRSYGLIKWKDFLDAEFPCRRVYANADGIAMLELELPNGQVFPCSLTGDNEWRREILENPSLVLNRPITARFQTYHDSGIPQFARAIVVREDL